jgi:hypothetical protein
MKRLLPLLLLSCTRVVPHTTACYTCTTKIEVTKPGCPVSRDTATYTECNWTAQDALRWMVRNTYTDRAANGYRARVITNCNLNK